jgi:hypothetical protein
MRALKAINIDPKKWKIGKKNFEVFLMLHIKKL